MWATLPQELGADSAPLRYRCPKALLHGSSPLARQEQCSTPESSSEPMDLRRRHSLPPFEDIFDAAAEQPPPYQAVCPVPNASFYGLAFERPLDHSSPRPTKVVKSEPMVLDEDDMRYLRSLRHISHGDSEFELMELDPTTPISSSSSPSIHSSVSRRLGPWSSSTSFTTKSRDYLERSTRDNTSLSRRKLECLRKNFILQNMPHLSQSLNHFETRAGARAPVIEMFYDWYEPLAVDQRVKHMPYFMPERLDMVQVTPKAAKSSEDEPVKPPVVQRKPASFDSPSVSSSMEDDMPPPAKHSYSGATSAVTEEDVRARSPSPPPAFNAPHDPCDWDEFERIVRWARVLSKRKSQKALRKEALVRAWTEAITDMDLSQWDQQLRLCNKYREARLQRAEEYWDKHLIKFEGKRYDASLFPSSYKKYFGVTPRTPTTPIMLASLPTLTWPRMTPKSCANEKTASTNTTPLRLRVPVRA